MLHAKVDCAGVENVALFYFHLHAPIHQTLPVLLKCQCAGQEATIAKHIDMLSPLDGSSSTFPESLANIIKFCIIDSLDKLSNKAFPASFPAKI